LTSRPSIFNRCASYVLACLAAKGSNLKQQLSSVILTFFLCLALWLTTG